MAEKIQIKGPIVVTDNLDRTGAKNYLCEAWRDHRSVGAITNLDDFVNMLVDEIGNPSLLLTREQLRRSALKAQDVVISKMRSLTTQVS